MLWLRRAVVVTGCLLHRHAQQCREEPSPTRHAVPYPTAERRSSHGGDCDYDCCSFCGTAAAVFPTTTPHPITVAEEGGLVPQLTEDDMNAVRHSHPTVRVECVQDSATHQLVVRLSPLALPLQQLTDCTGALTPRDPINDGSLGISMKHHREDQVQLQHAASMFDKLHRNRSQPHDAADPTNDAMGMSNLLSISDASHRDNGDDDDVLHSTRLSSVTSYAPARDYVTTTTAVPCCRRPSPDVRVPSPHVTCGVLSCLAYHCARGRPRSLYSGVSRSGPLPLAVPKCKLYYYLHPWMCFQHHRKWVP